MRPYTKWGPTDAEIQEEIISARTSPEMEKIRQVFSRALRDISLSENNH